MQEKKLLGLLEKLNNSQSAEISEFKELVSAFDNEIVSIDQKLAELQDCIHSYKLPAKDELDLVTQAIEQLSEKYRKIYSLTKNITSSEEIHETDGVENFICAVEHSKHLALRAKVNEAREILSRFCRIVPPSSDPKCIEHHQQQAQNALEKLANIENQDVESLLELANAPKVFLDAFDCDSEADEFFDLVEKAREIYGQKVSFLLTIKKFREAEPQETVAQEPELKKPEPQEAVSQKPESQEPATEKPEPQEPIVDEPAVEQPPVQDEHISANGDVIVPPLKKFKDDIIPLLRSKIHSFVLPALSKFGFLNRHQISAILKPIEGFPVGGMQMDEGVKAHMYVEYEMAGVDGDQTRYYTLSRYFSEGFNKNKDKVKKALLLSYSQGGLIGKASLSKTEADSHIRKNGVLFTYYGSMSQILEKQNLKKIVDETVRTKNSYKVPVPYEDRCVVCYLILDASDAAESDCQDVLVVADAIEIPQVFNAACENVYVAKDGRIYKCNPREGSVSDQVLEIETRPEPVEPQEKEPEVSAVPLQAVEPAVQEENDIVDDTSKDAPPPPMVDDSVYVADDANREPIEEPTAGQLIGLRCRPKESELLYVAEELLKADSDEDVVIQSLLLAETASFEEGFNRCGQLSKQIQLATHLFLDKSLKYSQEVVVGLEYTLPEITLAIYLQGMVTPVPHDYGFKGLVRSSFENFDNEFKDFAEFKPLYNALLVSLETYELGFTKNVLRSIDSSENLSRQMNAMREKAKMSLIPSRSSIILAHKPFNAKYLYDPNCDMYKYVKWVEEGKTDSKSLGELKFFLETIDVHEELTLEKVEAYVDECWAEFFKKSSTSHAVKRKFVDVFYKRIEVVKEWVDCFGGDAIDSSAQQERKDARDKIVQIIDSLFANLSWKKLGQGNILELALKYIKMYLTSSIPENYMLSSFSELLKTGCISLDEDGMPFLDRNMTLIRYNEPWLYALRHIVAEKKDFDSVRESITTDGDVDYNNRLSLFDSLHQLDMIDLYLNRNSYSSEEEKEITWNAARVHAEHGKDKFKDDVGLRYTYGQFGEREKEELFAMVDQFQDQFFERGDFAQWKWFLDGLVERENGFAVRIGKGLAEQLQKKKASEEENVFLKEAQKAFDEKNYALAEEYINRYDHNDDVEDYNEEQNAEKSYFDDFLSPRGAKALIGVCRTNAQRPVAVYGEEYLKENVTTLDVVAEKSDSLLRNWWLDQWNDPLRIQKTQNFFDAMGFEVSEVTERTAPGESFKHFTVKVKPVDKSLRLYKHPITSFGTGLSSINVICVNRNLVADNLVPDIFDYCVKKSLRSINTVVLINLPLDLSYRNRVADLTHTPTNSKNPFLLIDVVLLVYLASLRRSERITAMLQCTLPYSTYQPFCDDNSSSGIGDEMFFGREEEISSLTTDNPPCFVYGGRQLGKTTLLLRAANLCHKPELKEVAVYVDIKHCNTEGSFVEKIVQAINSKLRASRISIIQPCKRISILKTNIERHFGEGKLVSLFLLMDESDVYLESISKDNYSSLEDFIALKRSTHNQFRFVFAGLHNVSRAKNAARDNSLLGQFGRPLCVRPLRYRDASNLLLRPLRYLGFKVAKYPYLDSILANTNYYPGMIQFFGNILVKRTLIDKYNYSSSGGNPPFLLDRSQLSRAIASDSLNKSIQEKFVMSLQLDDRYLMLSKCITALYHINDKSNMIWMGFSIAEIKEMADFLGVKILANEEHYEDLLNEMVDMGILELSDNKYRLRRRAFVDMIGSSLDKIEQDVKEANFEFDKKNGT
ncbi:hypothetical protein SAMN05720761_11419 [Fibrobacter sp. UWCM]|uniref:hypothetical protein n=1 Tax=Fibrobacter sp. UWCM TaxID=1896208 RepID=UPI00091A68AB|nr:hypothetical protein [Fibrobacter sp. UWCM]SHH39621.1 hypothetical protein SAMN05720761_11419 [Fibrobacter sp. UWCM]